MISVHSKHDKQLCQQLESLSDADKDYWSFKGNSRREHGHGLFQYPAMMVPQVVESILNQVCSVHPDIERVGDPFAGSGTVMTESMMRGLSFSGADINPLAILLCQVKRGPFFIDALRDRSLELNARIDEDSRWAIESNFYNRDKWFARDVQIDLSKIRRSIRLESNIWARKFFWVALAETVRATSNSRTSTFKLHIRTQEDMESRTCDPIGTFKRTLERNVLHYENQAKLLLDNSQLNHGRYQQDIAIKHADVRNVKWEDRFDIVITSPPYGDNATTVPYGQYSYLPLQWIDITDIDQSIDEDCLGSAHEIDSRSLGGSKRVNQDDTNRIKERSSAFAKYIESLDGQPKDRSNRVTAFFRDLDNCFEPILDGLNPGGLMIWVLGNRNVGGKQVPLDQVLADLLQTYQAKLLCKLTRRIPSKRMAIKNSVAETISTESILVMRKAM